MVRTRSMTAVLRRSNPIKTKAAPPKKKAAQPKSKQKPAPLKRPAAALSEEQEKMMAAARAVDVQKILTLKNEAIEAMETKCFPLTAKAKLAAAALKAKLAAAEGRTQQSEKVVQPEKKKKTIVKYLVSQGYIDHMKEAGLFRCVDEIPEEELAKESQLFREGYRANVLLTLKLQACQQVLLDQYDAFGYAYDVKEVAGDEFDGEGQVDSDGVLVVNN